MRLEITVSFFIIVACLVYFLIGRDHIFSHFVLCSCLVDKLVFVSSSRPFNPLQRPQIFCTSRHRDRHVLLCVIFLHRCVYIVNDLIVRNDDDGYLRFVEDVIDTIKFIIPRRPAHRVSRYRVSPAFPEITLSKNKRISIY